MLFRSSESSLKLYFSSNSKTYEERFMAYSTEELASELRERINELSHTSCLSLLSTLEATFRIDYLQRNYTKTKDPLSRSLRVLFNQKENRASLESDILEIWKEHVSGAEASQLIKDLKGALKYRHWLAHGRYWQPRLGRPNYDYDSI